MRIVFAVLLALSLAAPAAAQSAGSLRARLPERIQKAGIITIGSDVSYAPVEFYKTGTDQVQGLDYDLARALGAKLGVKVAFVNTTFDGIIPALLADRFDIVMSAMNDTPEREKRIDFIDYFLAGSGILVRKGNPERIFSLADLCGKTADAEKGTAQEHMLAAQSAKCAAAHKPPITVLALATDTDALQQLKVGRSVAHVADFPVAAYAARLSGGLLEIVGKQYAVAPYGIGVRKDDRRLRDALQAALRAVIADGTYAKVLRSWDLPQGALTSAAINGGARYQ